MLVGLERRRRGPKWRLEMLEADRVGRKEKRKGRKI